MHQCARRASRRVDEFYPASHCNERPSWHGARPRAEGLARRVASTYVATATREKIQRSRRVSVNAQPGEPTRWRTHLFTPLLPSHTYEHRRWLRSSTSLSSARRWPVEDRQEPGHSTLVDVHALRRRPMMSHFDSRRRTPELSRAIHRSNKHAQHKFEKRNLRATTPIE